MDSVKINTTGFYADKKVCGAACTVPGMRREQRSVQQTLGRFRTPLEQATAASLNPILALLHNVVLCGSSFSRPTHITGVVSTVERANPMHAAGLCDTPLSLSLQEELRNIVADLPFMELVSKLDPSVSFLVSTKVNAPKYKVRMRLVATRLVLSRAS